VPHEPLPQVPAAAAHIWPEAAHTPSAPQQPPFAQLLPPQQGSPVPPHAAHTLAFEQMRDDPRQA